MAIIPEKLYFLRSNAGTSTNPILNVSGVETLVEGNVVNLWAKEYKAMAEVWKFTKIATNKYNLLNVLNQNYKLTRDSSGNCTMRKSPTSAQMDISIETVSEANSLYKIKLYNTVNGIILYLTSSGTSNGSNVTWSPLISTGNTQVWSIGSWTTENSSELLMPYNLNQKYTGNSVDLTQQCAVVSAMDVSSFYKGSPYTISEMVQNNGYTDADGVIWGNYPYVNFSAYINVTSESTCCQAIRTEIRSNHPVVIHLQGGTYGTHFVVAFMYTGTCTTYDDILVLDPYHSDTSSPIGAIRTLNQAITASKVGYVSRYKTTTAK